MTKGSMLISNANAVGTELVNQLGGIGYKPSEWADAINLLGIKSADIPSALASITPGSYSGSERGAIQYSNCNAVGAMLNKKFNTNRGFKPVEWEDAISKLTPLTEGTVTGAICNVPDGADDVPVKSWSVNIPANLNGVSSFHSYDSGKNLLNVSTAQGTGTIWFHYDNGILLKKGTTYTFSCKNYGTGSISLYTLDHTTQVAYAYITESSAKVAYRPTEDIYVCPRIYQAGLTVSSLIDVQLEVGSTATSYEPYTAPTVNTIDLGRTVYGADVDVVNGSGSETHAKAYFNGSESENWVLANTGTYRYSFRSSGYLVRNSMFTNFICDSITIKNTSENANDGLTCRGTSYENTYFYIFFPISNTEGVNDLTTFKAWLANHPCTISYPVSTPTPFTFDPITPTPETNTSVNFWSDSDGDSTVVYRKDPDAT